VTYKRSVGEFKPWAFVMWTLLFLIIALVIFRRFSFTTEAPDRDSRIVANEALSRVTELQGRLLKLEAQISALEKRDSAQRKCKSK